jgi:ribonuclease HI
MCDSSFADLSIGLYSTTGFIIFLFGAPFLWRSIKQKALAMSSTEAEYNAAAEAIKYISFFKRVLEELATALSKNFNLPFELQIDSQSCADDIRRGAPNQGRTRFMDLKTNKIIEKFQAGHFTYKWIAGSNNTADILTKRIRTVSLFVKHRDTLVSLLPSSAGECQDTDDVIPPRMQPLDAK